MTVKAQENLKFKGVNFISLHYECTKTYIDQEINLDITPSIFLHTESENSFEIIMAVKVIAEGSFNIETNAVGTFIISEGASEDYRHKFMNINAPAIMFPYVRAFISTLTSNFGNTTTGTVIIPAQNFLGGELHIINPKEQSIENKDD